MNKQDQYDEDLLKKFLNPGKVENAPAGFTSKTFARIQIELGENKLRQGYFARNRIPVISALVVAVLITTAIFIPANQDNNIFRVFGQFINGLRIELPSIDFTLIHKTAAPGWLLYAIGALFLLFFFDKALSGIFHRKGEN